MAEGLHATAQTLLDCVCDALSAAERPVCTCYRTIGVPLIRTCCDCDADGTNGELSIHFRRMFDADSNTLTEVQRVRPCKGGLIAAQFRLVLARCVPVLDEHGQLPPSEDLEAAAEEQMTDLGLMWTALTCCSETPLRVDDLSTDPIATGGCSLAYADVTVAVRPPSIPE